jgi:hypothetical protein
MARIKDIMKQIKAAEEDCTGDDINPGPIDLVESLCATADRRLDKEQWNFCLRARKLMT